MLRVTIISTGVQGSPYYTNFFFGGSTDLEAAAANAAASDFWNDLNGVQHAALDWVSEPEVFQIDPATGQTTAVYPVAPQSGGGSAAGEANPWATQGLIRWRTGQFVAGREVRGRTFLPATVEPQNTEGVPGTGFITIVNTAATAFLTAAGGGGGLVVYSRAHGQAADVSQFSTWNQWAQLRTRRD